MTNETKTIRVSQDTLEALSKYGHFKDNWNNCIQNLLKEHNKLKSQLKELKQKST